MITIKCKARPHVVDAVQMTIHNQEEIALWCGGEVKGYHMPKAYRSVEIYNREGKQSVRVGDWVYHEIAMSYDFKVLPNRNFIEMYNNYDLSYQPKVEREKQ